jgi:hypothetical protein
VQEPDACGPVRVVLDRRDPGRHAELVALEVDDPIEALMAATLVADRDLALAVSPRLADQPPRERLVRRGVGDLVERRASHLAQAGTRRSVASEWHL